MLKSFFKKNQDSFYVIFRFIVGLMFFLHGAQKFGMWGDMNIAGFAGGVGLPLWLGYIVALVELLGGAFIALGFFARPGALVGAIDLIVALIIVHFPLGINPLANGGELALLYIAFFIVVLARGAGKAGLEKFLLGKEHF